MADWTEVMIAYPHGDEEAARISSSGLPLHPVGMRIDRLLAGAVKRLDESAFLLRVASQAWNGEPQIFIRPEGCEFSVVRRIDIINFLDDTFERLAPEHGSEWNATRDFSAAEIAEHAAIIHVEFLQKQEANRAKSRTSEEYVRSIVKAGPPAWLTEKSGDSMPRTKFSQLHHEQQWLFIKSGGIVVGDPPEQIEESADPHD